VSSFASDALACGLIASLLTLVLAACTGGGTPASVRPELVEGPIPRQRRLSLPKPQRFHSATASLAFIASTLALALAACAGGGTPASQPPVSASPPWNEASAVVFRAAGGDEARLAVEVVDTAEERRTGLMFRESLPENAGMLFVFEQDTQQGFWMKDTTIPLSIAFIDAGGTVIDIQDMRPLDLTLHSPPSPYRYAVEANQGWFARKGVAAGAIASIQR